MNDENKIGLSIEMYEDLKETLVKAIKNAKAGGAGNAGLENVQLERIERLIEAAELSQEQITQLLEHLHATSQSFLHCACAGSSSLRASPAPQKRPFSVRNRCISGSLRSIARLVGREQKEYHRY